MKRIYGEELQKIQLEILDVVVAFCEENNISYWLDSGTLLGAIRHKGYIPWDDDIDIGMLRPDYDRFLSTFNSAFENYKVYSIENNPDFYYAHAKVLDLNTTLYEPDRNGNKLSINIDVFVYDNVPDAKTANWLYKKRDIYRLCHMLHTLNFKPKASILVRSGCALIKYLIKPFPKNFFIKKLSKNSKCYWCKETQYIGNFTAYSKIICDKKVFSDFTTAEFEGKQYRVPIGYDEWLRCFYGDYMQLPPIEKRVSHHQFEAYITD